MTYLERLRLLERAKMHAPATDKTDKGASVSFVSACGAPFSIHDRGEPQHPQPLAMPIAEVAERVVDEDDIEQRIAMAAGSVPECYLDGWARLQFQRPSAVEEAEWRGAVDDAGIFLDHWGADAETLQWTPGELLDVPRPGLTGGLIWSLKGARVDVLGLDHARFSDGRQFRRRGWTQ
jgi:hypothetical protein